MNKMFRKVVQTGTATLSDVEGYEVGGKTGTAQVVEKGVYTNKNQHFCFYIPVLKSKVCFNCFTEDTKLSKNYIYKYRNKSGSYKGTPFNTAGWTSVEISGKIIDKIGPILATQSTKSLNQMLLGEIFKILTKNIKKLSLTILNLIAKIVN